MINTISCDPYTEGKPIKDFPGYRVTADGFIWTQKTKRGGVMTKDWRKLKNRANNGGYMGCQLTRKNKCYHFSIHIAVLTAFVGERPEGMQGCHNDGNKSNNTLDNLRWDTPKNNHKDRESHGTGTFGEGNPNAKLNNNDVAKIKRLLIIEKVKVSVVAKMYSVTYKAIWVIKAGKRWGHIPMEANNV